MRRRGWPILVLGVLILLAASQGYPLVSAQSRILYGYVYSATTGKPIAATVTVSQCLNQQTATTGADGSWQLSYPYGTSGTITFSAPGYASQSFQLEMNAQWYYAGGVVSLQS
jgi:hypothetical protein